MDVSLENIALKTCLKFLDSACSSFLEDTDDTLKRKERATSFAERFNKLWTSVVPSVLANYFTNAYLSHMDFTHNQNRMRTLARWKIDILLIVGNGLFHPEVTTIEPHPDMFYCISPTCISKFNTNLTEALVFNRIETLPKLLSLQVVFHNNVIKTNMKNVIFRNCLRAFSGRCSDQDLKVLVTCCPNLENLHLQSSTRLTDVSVETILSLKFLRSFFVGKTAISDNGHRTLVSGLVKMEFLIDISFVAFSALKCDDVSQIVNSYPFICKSSTIKDEDFMILKNIRTLEGVKLKCTVNELLYHIQEFVPRLVYLTLDLESFDIDITSIQLLGVTCCLLKCFKIDAFVSKVIDSVSVELSTPGFLSLECLTVDLDVDIFAQNGHVVLAKYIISNCTSVRRLRVGLAKFCSKFEFMFEVFNVNPLGCLEEMYWEYECEGCDDTQVATLMVDNCPYLEVCGGFSKVRSISKSNKVVNFIRHNGVRITPASLCKQF
ncbi:uncharacterized protein [Periplaneta americana]|uniref:uncharacterized protein n=1 Tax=Periplaneta americana TaxID=6978 RepID=UPI0037E6FADD